MDVFYKPLSIPTELLDLNDVEIDRSYITRNNEIYIEVHSIRDVINCRKCGKNCVAHGKGKKLTMRHLPIFGKKTFIVITPPRGKCEYCDKNPTTTQTLDWFEGNGRQTKFFEDHLIFALIHSTIADVSIKEDVSEGVIQRVLDHYIPSAVTWSAVKALGVLGIDEISIKKGHQDYLTVVTCRLKGNVRILALIKGREKADIKAFLASIPLKKRRTIHAVCCDMYNGYINAAEEIFGKSIPVVIDRFHVAKLYRQSLVELRKHELSRIKREMSEQEYQALKPAIAILVKQKECYSVAEKKILEPLFKFSPLIKSGYRLMRQLTTIFNTNHRKPKAVKKINDWLEKAEAQEIKEFRTFVKTLKKHQNNICNYFSNRYNSGFVEGMNNKIKVLKRRCYGIYNIKNFFQRIFLDIEGYRFFNENQLVTALC